MSRLLARIAMMCAAAAAVAAPPLAAQHLPPLPDPSGWGTHVLAIARAPDGAIWVGTYGQGIYVLRPGAAAWENLHTDRDTTRRAISWDFVHAFAFGPGRNDVWYGTVGNGWGLSRDGGRTWRNWELRELGPKWQYVAPNGIVVRGDTVFIATADGLRWSADRGAAWHEVADTGATALPSRYILTMAPAAHDSGLWISTLKGFGIWNRRGFRPVDPAPTPLGPRLRTIFVIQASDAIAPLVLGGEGCAGSLRPKRRQEQAHWECMTLFRRTLAGASVRAMDDCDRVLCAMATSEGALVQGRMGLVVEPPVGAATARAHDVYAALVPPADQPGDTLFGTACGMLGSQSPACLQAGDTAGASAPAPLKHTWFARPIAPTDQPYIDQTYRYGSTMGGNFQEHQGVEFNNPTGTTVHAIGAGTVVYAGRAEQGSNTVAIRQDSTLTTPQGRFHIFSVYYHNSELLVRAGDRVSRGQAIARVGNTGRATNDHLHLEVHAAPVDSVRLIVDSLERYPRYTTNPELWIEPLDGTGVVAGRVVDAQGQPVPQARIYGLVKPEPQETPFSYAETYGAHAHPDPAYGENFAVGDVPAGDYTLGVDIGTQRVFRRIHVEAGKVTWVEFRP